MRWMRKILAGWLWATAAVLTAMLIATAVPHAPHSPLMVWVDRFSRLPGTFTAVRLWVKGLTQPDALSSALLLVVRLMEYKCAPMAPAAAMCVVLAGAGVAVCRRRICLPLLALCWVGNDTGVMLCRWVGGIGISAEMGISAYALGTVLGVALMTLLAIHIVSCMWQTRRDAAAAQPSGSAHLQEGQNTQGENEACECGR